MSSQSFIAARAMQRVLSRSSTVVAAASRHTPSAAQLAPQETTTMAIRAFSVNGYNHDGPRGKHITPHNPTDPRGKHSKPHNPAGDPPSTPTMPHDNQKGRSSDATPPIDIQDESDLEEAKKIEESPEFMSIMKAKSKGKERDFSNRADSRSKNPVTETGYKTTNSPEPVIDIRDEESSLQENMENAKEYMTTAAQEAQVKANEARTFLTKKSAQAKEQAAETREYMGEKTEEAKIMAHDAKEYLDDKTEEAKDQAEETREYLTEKSQQAKVKAKELKESGKVHAEQAKTKAQETKEYLGSLASRTQETLKPYIESAKESLQSVKGRVMQDDDTATMNRPVGSNEENIATSKQNHIAEREYENGENGKDRTEIEYHDRKEKAA